MKKIEFFVSSDNLIFEKEADCINHEQNVEKEEKPYLYKFKLDLSSLVKGEYNPNYGEDRKCECGHAYYRHFDTYEDMDACGCKYCGCYTFKEEDLSYKVAEVEKLTDSLISYLEIEDKMYQTIREMNLELKYEKDFKETFKSFCEKLNCEGFVFKVNQKKTVFFDYTKDNWIEKYKTDFNHLTSKEDQEWLEGIIQRLETNEEVNIYMEVLSNLKSIELTYELKDQENSVNISY